jgi:hypothetical protein
LTCISLKEIVTFEKIQNAQDERFGAGSAFLAVSTKLTTAKMPNDDYLQSDTQMHRVFRFLIYNITSFLC